MKTLRKKLLFIGFIILLAYSSTALAQTETETIITDTDTLDGGYFVRYREDISYDDTSVTVILSSSEPIEFGTCDEGDLETWNDGGSYPVWYYNAEDVLSRTMTVILDKGTYDFCLLNWGVNTASYTIAVTITFDPSNTGGLNTIWYVVIAVIVIGGLIGISLGVILSLIIDSIAEFETSITIFSVVVAFSVSGVVGVIFGTFPAKRAAEVNPIEALRYE